ncbi:MAG: flagellin [bacterium]|nr:flagellin [bacterium]
MSDFSIANNLDANAAELNLARSQSRLSKTARALSSGLRIESAADDPSGLAISEELQTRVDAFTTASQNVTTAQNAAAVADGALSTITGILLRIRAIAVNAASSISSDRDRTDLQAEIASLLHEIDRISENTNFNGQPLLDGSHSGFVAAQPATLDVTANTVLSSASSASGAGLLLASATFATQALQPTIYFNVLQNVTASASPQTVSVSDAQYIQPGSIFTLNGATVTVQSVDPANGTITAVFSTNAATNDVASSILSSTFTSAVSAGTQLVTLAASAQPLYAGETLQVDYGSFSTNEVVVVQKVMSPTSFVATFTKAHAANAAVFNVNGTYISSGFGPGNFSFNFGGTPTDGAPIGSTAYVVETTNGSFPPPNGSHTQVVATGTVIGGSVSSTTIDFPTKIPNYFGGSFEVLTALGYGTTPLINTVDGTIKLQVVNTGASIAVQESFYDTATQTEVTSPYLLASNERALLLDGVYTTVGNVTANDVGTTAYVKIHQATAAITAANQPALSVQSGAEEGDTIALGLPSVSAASLRVSNVTVLAPQGGDPTLAAQDTIGQVDFALASVLGTRAQLGAILVRFSEDAQSDDTAAANLQGAESTIRDANVGTETTDYALTETTVQIGLQVLSQANSLPEQVLKLFR